MVADELGPHLGIGHLLSPKVSTICRPPRKSRTGTRSPARRPSKTVRKVEDASRYRFLPRIRLISPFCTGDPAIVRMTSPGRMPAAAAFPSEVSTR